MGRLRGLRDLVHDAIESITDLVQDTHESSARTPIDLVAQVPGLEAPAHTVDQVRKLTADTVFATIRGVNRGVQKVGNTIEDLVEDVGGERVAAQLEQVAPPPLRRAAELATFAGQGALNAVLGDFLKQRGNSLAIEMGFYADAKRVQLSPEGVSAALPAATSKLCVLVHGLGCTESVFHPPLRDIELGLRVDYGALLTRDQGFSVLYVRYNTGLHISENARELSRLLEELVACWPCALTDLVLIGHSMGGLVCRGATHYAEREQRAFLPRLSHLLCIGSPHMGAPLERASNAIASLLGLFDVAGTQVPAKILNARSAGIKDLRFGYMLDEHWTAHDPDAFLRDGRSDVPLTAGVVYGFVAASYFTSSDDPLGKWLGDLLVSVASASGQHSDPSRQVPFQLGHVLSGVHHQALLTHPKVYEKLLEFLAANAEQRA
jgi:pimeloyl-ACP methyl ester carboxylesterase